MKWDPIAAAHLGRLVEQVDRADVTKRVREIVRELWRANVDRQDRRALYDDSSTLGFTASRNVTNRIFAELRAPNGALLPRAVAVVEAQVIVLKVADISLRFVKAPVARGRQPRFLSDFVWEAREGRAAPAARNAAHFRVPTNDGDIDPLFELSQPDAEVRIAECKDVFVVWAGDMEGRTAGWYGLPTLDPGCWLAVQDAWFDEDEGSSPTRRKPDDPTGGPKFSEIEPPSPQLNLRRRRRVGNDNV